MWYKVVKENCFWSWFSWGWFIWAESGAWLILSWRVVGVVPWDLRYILNTQYYKEAIMTDRLAIYRIYRIFVWHPPIPRFSFLANRYTTYRIYRIFVGNPPIPRFFFLTNRYAIYRIFIYLWPPPPHMQNDSLFNVGPFLLLIKTI